MISENYYDAWLLHVGLFIIGLGISILLLLEIQQLNHEQLLLKRSTLSISERPYIENPKSVGVQVFALSGRIATIASLNLQLLSAAAEERVDLQEVLVVPSVEEQKNLYRVLHISIRGRGNYQSIKNFYRKILVANNTLALISASLNRKSASDDFLELDAQLRLYYGAL
jgi:hypothetical protein